MEKDTLFCDFLNKGMKIQKQGIVEMSNRSSLSPIDSGALIHIKGGSNWNRITKTN